MADTFSDTVACALSVVFYYLATKPSLQNQLRGALESCRAAPTNTNLSQISLLEAVIQESFRIHTPVAASMQRLTPQEGIVVGDIQIPGDVDVYVPFYPLARGNLHSLFCHRFLTSQRQTLFCKSPRLSSGEMDDFARTGY